MPLRRLHQRIAARPLYLWALLWAAVTALYLPVWKGGFQQDFQGWLQLYHDSAFADVINRSGIPVHSFYQLTQLQLYGLTKLFGVHPVPWFLLFTALHALNGVLLYRLCRAVFSDLHITAASWIAAVGTLLVLFNPSMTEVVLWKAAYHYLIAIQGVLWSLLWARQYLLTGAMKWALRCMLLLMALAFTLEIWYTIPALVLLLATAYWRASIISGDRLRAATARLIAPLLVVFALHLITYRITYGTWLAHTAYTSAGDDSPFLVAGRIWSYEWHLLGFGRFFPGSIRHAFYEKIGSYWGGALVIGILLVLAEVAWRRFPKSKPELCAAALLGAWSLVGLAIILHFIPPDIQLVGNDRYLYLTAFFQWMLVALVVASAFRRSHKVRNAIAGLLLLVCLGFTAKLIMEWRRSTKIFWAVQDKFVWKDAPLVLILNMPATYNGIGIIRGSDTSELTNHLRVFGKGALKGRIYDVSSYNMQHPWDGATVVVQDSIHLHVTLNQWGSWWQQAGLGAVDRSNALFDLHFTDPGHDYELTLKGRPPGMVILYQQGEEWRKVDMNQIGVEQR